ncbi:hypothetical protein ERJ70_04990 [Sediminibacillus dalangtanensis]|uniref:Fur-regulated basic protein B n=1 Tax=Sediminibacillus dalangtanensis TaxID=2729421 RepID=A0ABX7VQD4_9BACI|nr:hypothetical protein [Sediminibacillus dalangtanensis]QTM98708.1 hypothetical protein ERJ70_04990 [Sediminibacillus dalangtanensis]
MVDKSDIFPMKKNLQIIEKHLHKNEKWLRLPEKHIAELESKATAWNTQFLKEMDQLEAVMKELQDFIDKE